MASLASHANVENTCLRILRERGYRLWVEGDPNDDLYVGWCAEKEGYSYLPNGL